VTTGGDLIDGFWDVAALVGYPMRCRPRRASGCSAAKIGGRQAASASSNFFDFRQNRGFEIGGADGSGVKLGCLVAGGEALVEGFGPLRISGEGEPGAASPARRVVSSRASATACSFWPSFSIQERRESQVRLRPGSRRTACLARVDGLGCCYRARDGIGEERRGFGRPKDRG